MTLVLATPLVALATARSLERLAIATKAIQMLPLAQRLEGLRAATGEIAPYLRKRYPMNLTPTLDMSTVDASGMMGGAVASWDGGPASLVQDYLLTFAASGTTYTLTTSAGAYLPTVSASRAWASSLTVDGYALTLTGPITTGDVYAWSTGIVQDPGIAFAVARIAAHALLSARGLDPVTMATLERGRDNAMAWAKSLGIAGEGELSPDLDTDKIDGGSYGPLGSGQSRADEWIYGPTTPTYPLPS